MKKKVITSLTPEYRIWRAIWYRRNSTKKDGGVRYKVTKRWHKFANFLEDVGYRPSPKHLLGRVIQNAEYNKDTVKWVTSKKDIVRSAKTYKWKGKQHTVKELAKLVNMEPRHITNRLSLGWTINKICSTPLVRKKGDGYTIRSVTWEGRKRRLVDLAREYGFRASTLYARVLNQKWPIKKALTTPIQGRSK